MEESEELYRNENGNRLSVKKFIETFSDKTQKVRETVHQADGEKRLIEEKTYEIDASGKKINE
jgi:hypothetical protein